MVNADAEFVKLLRDTADAGADQMDGADWEEFIRAEERMGLALDLLKHLGITYDPMTGSDK